MLPNPMCSMNSWSLQLMKNTQESIYKKTQWFQTSPCEACSYGWSPLWWRIEPLSPHPPAMLWHSPLNLLSFGISPVIVDVKSPAEDTHDKEYFIYIFVKWKIMCKRKNCSNLVMLLIIVLESNRSLQIQACKILLCFSVPTSHRALGWIKSQHHNQKFSGSIRASPHPHPPNPPHLGFFYQYVI